AGYSGLWSMAEFTPDYIKLDFSLTREIDTHPVKRGLIKTFLAFAESFGCELIAKGIERDTELTSLISMGVHHGEGYHLGRPASPKPVLSLSWPEWSGAAPAGGRPRPGASCNIPIRGLAETELKKVAPTTPVFEVKRIIGQESSISAVVVVEGNVPVGLIMSHHMDRALSSQYGMSLYYKRGVSEIMDRHPLVVDEGAAVEQVARQAMARDRGRIYDHIIVTKSREVAGIVSVQKMLDTLAAVQVEMAKGANPLTGLPGNVAIEQEVERRCGQAQGWVSIIYADLDNFKVYNDGYGFKNGDDVIKLTADVLRWASGRHGAPDDFVGHVGGDDFICITRSERAERICRAVTRVFGRCIRRHYTAEDRARGSIIGKDRTTGEEREYPLVAVSLAIVDCEGGRCDMDAISRRSAEMKKVAKRKPGNVWVRDRRGAPDHLLAEGDAPRAEACCAGPEG
ncbi:MAG: GGDEF domain-containing protein, partial [Desulfovibrionaceae bacterium]